MPNSGAEFTPMPIIMPIITLTTDFGFADPFVGIMKGVILGIATDAAVIDLCHEIPPQNIIAGALALEAAVPYFPPGAIHVAVVDPGVGSERAAIAVQTERATFVGPDNGIFELALRSADPIRTVTLTNSDFHLRPVSSTFHGRDIFAPVAAHLAAGVPFDSIGQVIAHRVRLNIPEPIFDHQLLTMHVIHKDRFGNLITNLRAEDIPMTGKDFSLRIAGFRIEGIHPHYSAVPTGEPLAYIGSSGRLEIGVRNGSAADSLSLSVGDSIEGHFS